MSKINPFLSSVIDNVPRLIGQLNRNPSSPYYGSFDRAFWHYRTNDISCARYQEVTLTLTLLYFHAFDGNQYYQDKIVKNWIEASLNFTAEIQNSNGSFSEWYVNEQSFVCTAFVTVALSDVLLEFRTQGESTSCGERILDGLVRAGRWLLNRREDWVMNQTSGAALALTNLWKLTGDGRFREGAKKKVDFIIDHQYENSWWSEYGGPDIGYLSLMIDYLIKYRERTQDEDIVSSIDRAAQFLTLFMHPNLTTGGEYGSRNTEYLIPSGFVHWAERNEHYRLLSNFVYWALREKRGIHPTALDDRYLSYLLYNWLQAGLDWEAKQLKPLDSGVLSDRLKTISTSVFYDKAGLVLIRDGSAVFISNLHKGGAFRLYADEGHYLDSGLEVVTPSGKRLLSSVLDQGNQFHIGETEFQVQGVLKPLREPAMKTIIMLIFKGFMFLAGRIPRFQELTKHFLRLKMISGAKRTQFSFKRNFHFSKGKLHVEDRTCVPQDSRVLLGTKSSYAFIPSSKYFDVQELEKGRIPFSEKRVSKNGEWVCVREFELKSLSVVPPLKRHQVTIN
jgi:hypothetical protein